MEQGRRRTYPSDQNALARCSDVWLLF